MGVCGDEKRRCELWKVARGNGRFTIFCMGPTAVRLQREILNVTADYRDMKV